MVTLPCTVVALPNPWTTPVVIVELLSGDERQWIRSLQDRVPPSPRAPGLVDARLCQYSTGRVT